MRPVPPTGNPTSPSTGTERERGADPEARRLLERDGLHLSIGHDDGCARTSENPAHERMLLALISSARHEVRSPLQSIQGFAELLAAESYGTLGSEQRVFVEHMIQSGVDLSRALDACFELIQAELFPAKQPLGPTQLARGLSDALTTTRGHTSLVIEESLSAIPSDLLIATDGSSLNKAVGAIVTALTPLMRGKMHVMAALRERQIELYFGPPMGDARIVWRPLADVARRSPSARALLWLRLATVEFERAHGTLETSEGYDRVRVVISP